MHNRFHKWKIYTVAIVLLNLILWISFQVYVDSFNFYLNDDKTTIYFYDEDTLIVNEIEVDLIRENDKITLKSEKLTRTLFKVYI